MTLGSAGKLGWLWYQPTTVMLYSSFITSVTCVSKLGECVSMSNTEKQQNVREFWATPQSRAAQLLYHLSHLVFGIVRM